MMSSNQAMLYFAYGSNLHRADWRKFCRRHGQADDPLTPLGPAWLPDHRPVYHYYSVSREGGALDVVGDLGQVTPGMLFQVSEPGWELLDRKEGAPGYYQRTPIALLTEDGGVCSAFTYQVVPERRESDFVPPTSEYLALVRDALAQWDLTGEAHKQAAAGDVPAPLVQHLFVYGLLQSGYVFGRFLDGQCRREPATAPGRVYDLGAYPAWQPAQAPHERVSGELLRFTAPASVLERTDAAEDFVGYGADSHYHRVLLRARSRAGGEVLAWCYRYARDLSQARRVPDGRWQPQQAETAEQLWAGHLGG
ncbi:MULTISPECIES: gamma-glutamylcyclotransferase [Thiorhodovibrio]|uniref:gamma-glutamylcyclotransferase n=1 Tax=Thiorhodovibrio TaxID=61593 RepID=UPI001914A655|nr:MULTISPECIES: gamma-glutamylcyclotransferase [Thiorhodovibrio]MBK5970093.1 hypothetical protein [Thiorhodovibrio winogradskyi]WPL13475.1 AIG2-like family protein [Thiorhodovibrio litoralis]